MEKQNFFQQSKLKKLQYFFQKSFCYDIIDPMW